MLDQAAKKEAINSFEILLEEIAQLVVSVAPGAEFADKDVIAAAVARVRADFAHDYRRVLRDENILFGPDLQFYGQAAADIFTRWEEEGGGPSLPAMLAVAFSRWGLDLRMGSLRAALMAALLAEVPNDLLYHGNEHYRKVLFHTLRLIAAHNIIFAGRPEIFGPEQMAVMLSAACVHDLGHQGGDNLRDGVYTPGYMEQRALDIARPYFDAAGMDEDERGAVETMVFCTDITFFAGDNSPCVRMRKLYRYYFWGDNVGDPSMLMMGRLRRYEDNPGLVRMAMLLHEADIATSAGLVYEQTRKETKSIIEERGMKTAGPGIVVQFLREQLGQTMYTEAGKQLFGHGMEEIIRAAEADLAAGVRTYYE